MYIYADSVLCLCFLCFGKFDFDMGVGVLDSLVSDAGGDYQAILMENQSLSRIYLK